MVHLLYGLAFEGLGQLDSAVAYLERATELRHLTSFNKPQGRYHLPPMLRRLAELEERRGNEERAIRHYQRLLDLWRDADPVLQEDVAAVRRAVARLTGSESG